MGDVGEVLVTVFNPDYPLIRFATATCPRCCRARARAAAATRRIRGWLGRADQATKVRGMFVQPRQIGEVLRRHEVITRARLVVTRASEHDEMCLQCEVEGQPPGLEARLSETIHALTGLRAGVELVPPGSLPNDGRVIEDRR